MAGSLYAGIDVGASATKVVLIRGDGEVVGKSVRPSGMDFSRAGNDALEGALLDGAVARDAIQRTVASGYGRKNVEFACSTKTEIACHAKGVAYRYKDALSIVDIGGQDNKIIKLGPDGKPVDFKMNRKCAAGTGAFLEEIARRMEVPVGAMNRLARKSTRVVEIGSFCTVFSATEILSLIRKGEKMSDIVAGAFRSVVKRICEMDALDGKVIATGGVVAHNPVVVELLSDALGAVVETPPNPQFVGAFGAAIFASEDNQNHKN